MIKLYKYFFEDVTVVPSKEIAGESRRSLNGKLHTVRIGENNKYNSFDVTIDSLDLNKLKLLYSIVDIFYDKGEESVEFITPEGGKYEVAIPLPLDDSFTVEGEEGNYTASLTLEEVQGGD